VPDRARPADLTDRYWRTFQRKLGEDVTLAGRALAAVAAAAVFAPLAKTGVIAFPTPTVGAILVFALVAFLGGIHLQAQSKPDA
jgi:hypothetical protein